MPRVSKSAYGDNMKDQNMQRPADLIVSVESRKGGVGKTTAALCLARILRKGDYAVLFLDMDVTGTNAANIAESPFWAGELHVIQEEDRGDAGSNARPLPVNLLTLFDQCFMAGKAIPAFTLQSSDAVGMRFDIDKVNVLGSQIYQTEKRNNQNNTNGTTCIERPGILFDDLHTLWLLEFVKQVVGNFARVVGRHKAAKVAVVLDNSPGYVGIAPAIHEWLTDCGPRHGKFLTVTSLDAQDLCACGQAIDALHDLYTNKWKTSRLFVEAGKQGIGIHVGRDQESFFMRLATSANGSCGVGDPLTFYRNAGPRRASGKQGESGQAFCNAPTKYQAAIVNRVPRAVKAGRLVYEFPTALMHGNNALGQLLDGNDRLQPSRDRMVSYDEYIENQFLLQSLNRGRRRSERRLHHIIESLRMAEAQLRHEAHDSGEDRIGLFAMDAEHHARLRAQLARASDIVSRARSAVDDAGLGHLARLVRDEWLPGSIIPDFRSALSGLLRESDVPYFDMVPFEFDPGPVNPEAQEFIATLKRDILMELSHSPVHKRTSLHGKTVELLAGVLSGIVGLSLTSRHWHSPLRDEVVGLSAMVLAIELNHWAKRGAGRSAKVSVQRFLAQESATLGELHKDTELLGNSRFFRHHIMREGDAGFAHFYRACTSAQARLIDFTADSRFLLQLLQFMVKSEMERGALFPFVRGIVEDVIADKTLSHEDAPSKMARALQTAEYFREFDGVLHKVLKDWGVAHE